MFRKFKEHCSRPITFGWYYKVCAICVALSAIIYALGIMFINGYFDGKDSSEDKTKKTIKK